MNTKVSGMRATSLTALALMLSITITGCTRTEITNTVTETNEVFENGGPADAEGGSVGVGWALESSRDPLSDQTVTTAKRSFQSGNFRIDVVVSCNDVHPKYDISAFDGQGNAAGLNWDDGGKSYDDTGVVYERRLDGRKADKGRAYGRRYDNVFTITDEFIFPWGGELAKARNAVLRFPLNQGDATIELDQTDGNLRSVLDPCLKRAAEYLRERDREKAPLPEVDAGSTPSDNSAGPENILAPLE